MDIVAAATRSTIALYYDSTNKQLTDNKQHKTIET